VSNKILKREKYFSPSRQTGAEGRAPFNIKKEKNEKRKKKAQEKMKNLLSVSQLEPFPPFRLLIFQLGSYFLKKRRKQKKLRLPKSKREMMRRSRLFSSPHCWTFWDDGNHPLAQEQILYIFPVCSFARDVGGRIVLTSRNKVLVYGS
jgi:hypothetical protein